MVLGMGIWDPIGYGTISRAASLFTERASASVLIGTSSGSVVLLILSLAIQFSTNPQPWQVEVFFFFSVGIVVIGLLIFFWIMLSSTGDYYINSKQYIALNNNLNKDLESTPMIDKEMSFKELFSALLELIIAQILLWTAYMLMISNFTYIPSSNGEQNNKLLSQILVYCNLFGLFVGRQLNFFAKPDQKKFLCISTPRQLLFWIWIHAFTLVPYVLYCGKFWEVYVIRNDYVFIPIVALFFIAAGYLNSILYILTTRVVSPSNRPTATSYVNVALMLGVLIGLGFSYILSIVLNHEIK